LQDFSIELVTNLTTNPCVLPDNETYVTGYSKAYLQNIMAGIPGCLLALLMRLPMSAQRWVDFGQKGFIHCLLSFVSQAKLCMQQSIEARKPLDDFAQAAPYVLMIGDAQVEMCIACQHA